MINKVSTNECCICHACSNICPVDAIEFADMKNTFIYPKINTDKCINCEKCEEVCPVLQVKSEIGMNFPLAFAAQSKKIDIRKKSTSGGIFYELSRKIIEQNGFVCGAILTKDFHVKHILTNEIQQVELMCGSKYAQSDINKVYEGIKEVLKEKKLVLFSGCPCQIAGLRCYLGKVPENLYLLEVVCHGIPSDEMLQSYIRLHERRTKSRVLDIKFRDKTYGWHRSSVMIQFENGKIYREPITVDAYMNGFLNNVTLKPSCYKCQFREYHSGSDLMVGDFWGAEVEMPNLDDNIGTSAVLVNTSKGDNMLKKLDIILHSCDVEMIIKYNKNIMESPQPNQNRDYFFKRARAKSTEDAIESLLWEKRHDRILRQIKSMFRYCKHIVLGKGRPLY